MEFVVLVLERLFDMNRESAAREVGACGISIDAAARK